MDNQELVEKGKKITAMVSIGGIVCSIVMALLIRNTASVFSSVLFNFLLYKGYNWVRYYTIICCAVSSIAIILFLIPYYGILYAIPTEYLIASTIFFIECIVMAIVLSVSRGVKAYMQDRKNERRKIKQSEV